MILDLTWRHPTRDERSGNGDDPRASDAQAGEERPLAIVRRRPAIRLVGEERAADQRGRSVVVREQAQASRLAEEEPLGSRREPQTAGHHVGSRRGLRTHERLEETRVEDVLVVEEYDPVAGRARKAGLRRGDYSAEPLERLALERREARRGPVRGGAPRDDDVHVRELRPAGS